MPLLSYPPILAPGDTIPPILLPMPEPAFLLKPAVLKLAAPTMLLIADTEKVYPAHIH